MADFVFLSGFLVLAVSLVPPGVIGQSVASGQAEKLRDDAPAQQLLTGDDVKQVEELDQKVAELTNVGRYAEAQVPARAILALRTRVQGATHWQTANAKRDLELLQQIAALPADAQAELTEAHQLDRERSKLRQQGRYREAIPIAERIVAIWQRHLGEEHSEVATAISNQAFVVENAGKYAEAETLYRRALAIRRKVLGEEHPYTAASYNNVAGDLHALGKYSEAQRLFRQALASYCKILGEEHSETAMAYNNVALSLDNEGKYDEGERLGRRALAIRQRVLGEDHEDTAQSYNNVAQNLSLQGRHAEAEPLHRRAWTIFRKRLGEEHPYTIVSYNNVASTLQAQGRYAEAEFMYRRALDLQSQILGKEHPRTLLSYNNLAFILNAQGRHAEAEALHRQALETRKQRLGEEHPDTARSYHNLARTLNDQGRYADAEPLYRRALAIFRKINEASPSTIASSNGLAWTLAAQGKHAEAEEVGHQVLALCQKVLGADHPYSVVCSLNLASYLAGRGDYGEAEPLLTAAAKSFEVTRRRISFSGLERTSFTAEHSPLPLLAAVAARNGKPLAAWEALENDLARGLLDDLSAQPLNGAERSRTQVLRQTLNRLDGQISALLSAKEAAAASREKTEELRKQREAAQAEFAQFQAELADKYGVAAGQVYDLARIQRHLPPDAALVAWVDIARTHKGANTSREHWTCVVRHRGPPVWTKLPGSGASAAWLPADDQLALQARRAFGSLSQDSEGQWTDLVRKLYGQRLAPVERHLGAEAGLPEVRHLIVLTSAQMAGIPVEVLTDRYTISYAPSGTMFAWLHEKASEAEHAGRRSRAIIILAVGDPTFEPAQTPAGPPSPEHGVLIAGVVPSSNAAGSGIKAGDVLLSYSNTKLDASSDLDAAIGKESAAQPGGTPRGAASIPVRVWREGRTLDLVVPPGSLGVEISQKPVAQALRAQREFDALTRGPRREAFTPLPGTRTEVQAIARVFPKATLLLGSEASEQNLDRLAATGRLREFRFLHFATHGVLDDQSAMRSALILAQDQLPDPLQQVLAGKVAYDGRLTAEQMLRTWQLDADLVTLSACQTGLGKYSGGEGYLGFSQALFLAGARSLVLSLWKVDDTATALLMTRFYENLLGARAGLTEPLPKAQALAEAKSWLRGLHAEEAQRLAAGLPGEARGSVRTRKSSQTTATTKPFAHPYYWSGFILIGDPR